MYMDAGYVVLNIICMVWGELARLGWGVWLLLGTKGERDDEGIEVINGGLLLEAVVLNGLHFKIARLSNIVRNDLPEHCNTRLSHRDMLCRVKLLNHGHTPSWEPFILKFSKQFRLGIAMWSPNFEESQEIGRAHV